jgi:uncharacterized protein (TIGR00299 family) protein
MHTLAFDGRTGASGDMVLGALVAAGADPAVLDPVVAALDVEYRVEAVDRRGIQATDVTVLLTGEDDGDDHQHGDGHHDHSHDHHGQTGDHDHSHGHGHDHAEGAATTRTYAEVLALLDGMDLPAGVQEDAAAVFELLGEAEAAVHGTTLADTAFHEVGADDAIADVVGVALLLDDIDPERVVTTPVAVGGGETTFSHGTYPVPVPAVVELLDDADFETYGGPVETELLTPTGAAILAHYAEGLDNLPTMRVDRSGYGAGTTDLGDRPNVLRAAVGETRGGLEREQIRVLETNLDDATPELLGGLQETLADAGALDVSIVPLTMKKSRPGHLVKVVCRPADSQRVARRLAEETGTLGVREAGARHRWVAGREVRAVTVEVGGETREVGVKVATDSAGAVYDVSAEYDDAAAVAHETDLPVREVMRRAEAAARAD